MANKSLFRSILGKLLPKTDTTNQAGGRAYAFPERHALAQYASTGCLNGVYYSTAQEQLEQVLELATRVEPDFLAKAAIHCRQRAFMKDMPALLCSVLAQRDGKLLERVFARVIDDGKMLRNFVQILRAGVVGRKSLGSLPKRLVRQWLESQSDEQLFRASVGNDPSLADVVKMVHPKPRDPQREALFGWLLGRAYSHELLPDLVRQFEAYKGGARQQVPNLPFLMLTALDLGKAEWTAIARQAPWQTLRMNLNTFARHGVFEDSQVSAEIAARLRDPEAVRRSRVFPYQLLMAYKASARVVPAEVQESLRLAMEVATENVPEVAGQVYVCPDISGSMHSPVTGVRKASTSAVRCIDAAALVAAALLRKNSRAQILPFSDQVVPVQLNPGDSVITNAQILARLPSGGTNCSAPLVELNRRQARGDLVLLVSDNMSWLDGQAGGGRSTATMAAWAEFRARNPGARLVCLDMQPYASSQAAEREDILNIGGFADTIFEIIALFARGELGSDHWVGVIEAIQL